MTEKNSYIQKIASCGVIPNEKRAELIKALKTTNNPLRLAVLYFHINQFLEKKQQIFEKALLRANKDPKEVFQNLRRVIAKSEQNMEDQEREKEILLLEAEMSKSLNKIN